MRHIVRLEPHQDPDYAYAAAAVVHSLALVRQFDQPKLLTP